MDEAEIEKLIYKVIGAAMTVHSKIGYGLREKTYERALVVELQHLDIQYSQQSSYPVIYRDVKVDEYIPDLEVEDAVIVDTKTIENIGDYELGQMLTYLRFTQKTTGLIINFKHPSLQWRKVTLNPS
ncbi:GxxExxY protein [Coraliomargarita sp. SDUM461004]|uniref:GxxExxY protein n=1 Tax=Thalassobacterium sedimentorum TaxID=3041258 RepID=A0ABU1AHQ1_9BACT|nr:GxxExxY protein [Coraliomargarita sp. SDUM461004]MDQ8194352.1 GxxExxY protein [Coraliomargarita sp. SDUM461004]